MLGRKVIAALCCVLGFESTAFAYCSEPSFYESAPDPPSSWSRPDVPYCLQGYAWSGRHTCSSWDISAYQGEVEDYINELNNYISEANSFMESARRFAIEAAEYAQCEADEVLEQHE